MVSIWPAQWVSDVAEADPCSSGLSPGREYVGLAVKEGVVHIGKGEKLGSEWIALANESNKAESAKTPNAYAVIGKLNLGSAQARRLVQILLRTPATPPPLRSRINDLLLAEEPTFVSAAGFDTWAEFSKAAEKTRLVRLGMTGTSPWISLDRSHWLVSKVIASSPSVSTPPALPSTSASAFRSLPPGMGAATAASFENSPTSAKPRLSAKHLAAVSMFRPLCLVLLDLPRKPSPLKQIVIDDLARDYPSARDSVHAENWNEYLHLAAEAGLVHLGTSAEGKYVRLVGEPSLLSKAAGASGTSTQASSFSTSEPRTGPPLTAEHLAAVNRFNPLCQIGRASCRERV